MSGTGSSGDDLVPRLLRDLSEHERSRTAGAGPSQAPSTPPAITRFDIQEIIGEGATAVVYRARDRALNRTVAVKVLRETGSDSDGVLRERFRREGQAAAGLAHPNVVTVFDAAEEGGRRFLVMELVVGRPLNVLLKDPSFPRGGLVAILEKAAAGVAAAHERGIVHRDLKPANILVTESGEPKVGDFGLAQMQETRNDLTRTGTTLGTPLYMAPEQVQAEADQISSRTDVYALGAILYEILTGRPPHQAESLADLYMEIVRQNPVPPRRIDPGIPEDAQTIALKALEKDPFQRYPDAREFADDLARYRRGEPIRARPVGLGGRLVRRCRRSPVAVSLGAAALLALGATLVVGLRMLREIQRLASLAPDPRPWIPVFDGRSLACFLRKEMPDWKLENGFLINTVARPGTLQTERLFEDGEIRIRFECHGSGYLGVHIRLSDLPGYGVEWDRHAINQIAGAEHVLIFSCRGDQVAATLDGSPLTLTVKSPSLRGSLHFATGGGILRIRSIDFREAP